MNCGTCKNLGLILANALAKQKKEAHPILITFWEDCSQIVLPKKAVLNT